MNILVTGAKGFVGKNLVANLKNIQENKSILNSRQEWNSQKICQNMH